MRKFILLTTLILFFNCANDKEEPIDNETSIYFPEINSDIWETEDIINLNWNQDQLEPLLNFLEEQNTKSFIVLYNGKIVIESYLNNHTNSSLWYWASAGKTLTTAITGIAQKDGFINIDDKVSDYIGTGWTNTTLEQENLITCKNLLSMTSGLNDNEGDSVSSSNLNYTANAGSRWAYHNVYKKMQDIIAEATNTSWDTYFNTSLKDKIGMSGNWNQLGDFNLFWSNTRSMARFGLLMSAKGKWENTQIIPEDFISEATTTSQDINLSYGYLWWLNGKPSYHLPNSQDEFSGSLIPNAPDDMIAALGANDQKLYIVPSKKLVIVRMGQAADEENFALSSFDEELWGKINNLID